MPKGNPRAVPPKPKCRRKHFRDRSKPYNKDDYAGSKARRRARCERQLEAVQKELAELDNSENSVDSEEDFDFATHHEKRVVIKFFWQTLGRPRAESSWAGRDGVISYIRRRMGSTAPSVETVRSTLKRLVENPDDDLQPLSYERERLLSHEEDLFIGLLICEGHSQRSATFLINGDRIANGLATRWRADEARAYTSDIGFLDKSFYTGNSRASL